MCTPAKCRPARDTATNSEIGEKIGKEREVARYEICEPESEKYHGQIRMCLRGLFLCCGCGFYCGHLPLLTNLPHVLKDLKFTFCSSPVRSSGIFFKIYGVPFQVQWSCYERA